MSSNGSIMELVAKGKLSEDIIDINNKKSVFDFRRLEYHAQLGILKRDQVGENLKKLKLLIKAKCPDAKGNYPETGKKVLEKNAQQRALFH